MRNAQLPGHVSLNTLISRLRDGRYVIPDFQRDFAWEPWDISALMRSIFLDYYIGSLLLWRGSDENFDALSCKPIEGFSGEQRPEHIVLDGQQRLTAMHYAFFAPDRKLPRRAMRAFYFVRIDKLYAGEHDDAFIYEWDSRGIQRLLADTDRQFEKHLFPLRVMGAGGWDLSNWAQQYEAYWRERDPVAAGNAQQFSRDLRATTEEFQISFIELDRALDLAKVCDIFTQINSRGVRLDVFDLLNAMLRPKGVKLKEMWHAIQPRLDFVQKKKLNVYVLQVMSMLAQAYCSPKYLYFLIPGASKPVRLSDGTRSAEVLVHSPEEFVALWERAVASLEASIKRLRNPHEYGVGSAKYLPYASILPAFAALSEESGRVPAERRLDAQRKVRKWYWAAVFTNRYSGSVESTAARDFQDVTAWFADDHARPQLIDELSERFRYLDLRKEVRQGTSVYNGIFNLFVLQGARDWITGSIPEPDALDDHHIVPASWGRKHGIGRVANSVLNRTPLSSDTNRQAINDRLPNAYLPELIRRNGENTVRAVLESHFISPAALDILLRDPFSPQDFEDFLAERQRTILDAIEHLLIKERLDLSPLLRELDAEVEEVELALRRLVVDRLEDDPERLPDHVRVKLNESVKRALRANATRDASEYEGVRGLLEFSDLRGQLQQTICSKACWPAFQDVFGTKPALEAKFAQLAELRNAIRHSRTVDEITRKEGEAAILWFRKVLPG